MTNQPTEPRVSAIRDVARPPVADRAAFQSELDRLRVREKAHTREGDAIAAARRGLPMVEVDPQTPLIGADGPVPLIDIFDGRSQLIAYFHMWHTGRPAAEQCEGCTFNTSHINELSYLHSRDVSYAIFGQGPYEEISRYRDFMGFTVPWYSVPQDSVDRLVADQYFGILACYLRDGDQVFETYWTSGRGDEVMAPSYGLLDRTVYGRQEFAWSAVAPSAEALGKINRLSGAVWQSCSSQRLRSLAQQQRWTSPKPGRSSPVRVR
jgi:predicted dithiol-disulfide oxidoreductase (DUF899 family)